MNIRKTFSLLIIVFLFTISVTEIAQGVWPVGPLWADLPELEYIYDSGDTIWFYSTLPDFGIVPRYIVTYEKSTKSMRFHPMGSIRIPKDAPVDHSKSRQLPSYLHIEPHEITLKGVKIFIPNLTLEESERLREWSAYLQRNRHMAVNEFALSNALQRSFIEVNGVYYFGMKGGISEGIGHLGGLVVYRPQDEELSVLRSKYLVDCSATDIVRIGDELAIATLYRGEYFIGSGLYWEDGEERKVGLVLHNANTGKWRNIPTGDLDIIIREMSVIDDSLWMTTNWGISCYDHDTEKIRNWCWNLSLVEN
jgi:hypothetical protein